MQDNFSRATLKEFNAVRPHRDTGYIPRAFERILEERAKISNPSQLVKTQKRRSQRKLVDIRREGRNSNNDSIA